MSYRALYRVWRPQRFADLVGQEHITQTLMNALKEGHLSHAYLFNGPRGTGKTSAAKILAKAVNCEHGPAPEPCNACDACRRITEGAIMDVVEIDAASNRGVDEIRDLRDKVKYAPTEVRYKVYIIDEVHMLTTEAFNALLKTLEEPPAHVIFILATTEPHKLLPTIISRCQRFSFRRFSFEHIVGRLRMICESQQIKADEQALIAIARAADGGMRDALSLLDQALAFGGDHLDEQVVLSVTGAVSREVIFEILQSIANFDATAALNQLDECVVKGVEPDRMIQDLTHACRDLLLVKTAPQLDEIGSGAVVGNIGKQLAERLSIAQLTGMLDELIRYQQQMKWVAHPRILLEMALVRLCQPTGIGAVDHEAVKQIDQLTERIRQLEQVVEKLKQSPPRVAHASAPPQVGAETGLAPKSADTRKKPVLIGQNWLQQLSEKRLAEVKRAWPEILHEVKKERITVHAWLVDGEPVAATNDTVIVTFKSQIHRDTTEKDVNKSLIQQVMSRVLGSPTSLHTLMVADWEEWKSNLRSVPAEVKKGEYPKEDVDVVKKAVELFGDDLVEITEHS